MGGYFHLSMRVPWRDRPWDGRICDHPINNSSCVLLPNIGEKRDDELEASIAGKPFTDQNTRQRPCLSERATFMSDSGYRVQKTHPYNQNKVLKGHLEPTYVDIPAYGVEAVPFRWLSRETFEEGVWPQWDAGYDPNRESRVHELLSLTPGWVMDGANQQGVIRQFFECVSLEESLIFFYMKHSPLQETETRRLLVGAAHISQMRLPGMWDQTGSPPFNSSMWETAVTHSLRPDGSGGILLPYQRIIELIDSGRDVSSACAWAPDGHAVEFSYVTEHVSNDTAIQALQSLRAAAEGFEELGFVVPEKSMQWTDQQITRLWEERGPTPGLGAALSYLGVQAPHKSARTLLSETDTTTNPWTLLERGLTNPAELPEVVRVAFTTSAQQTWAGMTTTEREALRVASAMQLSDEQLSMLMMGPTPINLSCEEFVDNPYFASICTYGEPLHVEFSTVDRALLPPAAVPWPSVLPDASRLEDGRDQRRTEAALVEVLERRAADGDTLVAESDLPQLIAELVLETPIPFSPQLLRGQKLDAASLALSETWSPLAPSALSDDSPALKLSRLVDSADVIRREVLPRIAATRHQTVVGARQILDRIIAGAVDDGAEEAARSEKAAGLEELVASRVSVLIGAAGTGKTTLLKALVQVPEVAAQGVVLLAPTGKARVQLEQKVGHPAYTIASFLLPSQRFKLDSGRYVVTDDARSRRDAGLVVIDEASMLTEEMLAATLDGLKGVRRLVLVGDPRQLPPIGAGRPFVDLVERLKPNGFTGPVHVGPNYVELTVLRRQGGEERDDLALASWFGGEELPGGSDDIWERLRRDDAMPTLRHVQWSNGDPLATLDGVLSDEILGPHSDPAQNFALSYGGHLDATGKYVNWSTGKGGAGECSEEWQILSPSRSRIYGTTEINRHLKRRFRSGALAQAQRPWSKFPGPAGPEQIVLGDKVMQTRNRRLRGYPKDTSLEYVANGEIGVVVGKWGSWKGKRPIEVEFSSQIGTVYSHRTVGGEDPELELAWAVTVHKSQGSEFVKSIVVLSNRARMSRELIYTALIRQKDRVILLHDGSIDDLMALAQPSGSETARRMTDLFRPPNPRVVQLGGVGQRFDSNLLHVTSSGELVRSKNEVIIADLLERIAPGRWRYELGFTGSDGRRVSPDFTIETSGGDTVYWEHLGMLNNPTYAAKWLAKKQWYADNGVLGVEAGGGPNGTLITTDDLKGVNVPEWTELAERVLGAPAARRPAKKAAPRRQR